jgi:putative membrane protein
MKKLMLSFCCLISFYIFQSCNNGTGSGDKDTVDSAQNINDSTRKTSDNAMPDTMHVADKDATDFAVKAASGGMMEVELGKIAQQKAMSLRVKSFGAMMEKDHSKANEELKARAQTQNIALPAKPGDDEQKMIDKLSAKSGKDFDKAYMDMMVDDHKKDIDDFKKAAEKCTDASLREFAGQTLPVLLKHLDSAQAITGKKHM